MPDASTCPFCSLSPDAFVHEFPLVVAFRDRFPVSPGHTLIITRRHAATYFDTTPAERAAMWEAVEAVQHALSQQEPRPDGFNVGFNAGAAAGQTVMHVHVHVIPRYRGDMDDPRGGVRHVIPSRGNYVAEVAPLATGGPDDPFARHVVPLFDRASEIAIVAAFAQQSGLDRLEASVSSAIARGASVRVLTGDYLAITQADALSTLHDWEQSSEGRLSARVIEVAALDPQVPSFHPKSWRFEAERFGVAFVGSSNLSRTALERGIEWNLRVDRDRDAAAYARVRESFEVLWRKGRRLEPSWIASYARRAQRARVALPQGELEEEPLEAPPEPHDLQRKVLEQLVRARQQKRRRGVVVMPTGLGKTWLAAFDYRQLATELGRLPKLLFVAHRAELLKQAAATYRRVVRAMGQVATVGWFVGEANDLDADLVFASIAKLSRPEHLARLAATSFDAVVVDEVHHAAADSYRRLLERVDPHFLLGLTATPERADEGDVLSLFDDFVAHRATLPDGIALGRLTPFRYFGVKDDVDFSHIPWRNRRFDPEALSQAVQTEARMQTVWRAWAAHPGTRTLVFCCSVAHANFVRAWLRARGVRVDAVYAGEGSDDRELALERLGRGELDAVCAVDMFNEGIDLPAIDRVVMLRPTESSVVFLQQLGRGLRAAPGKTELTVIDFVGNHRVFLARLSALLNLANDRRSVRTLLEEGPAMVGLPEGCAVELELEAVELLSRLYASGGADEVERAYRELRLERGERPGAGELFRRGFLPSRLRVRHGAWFRFVAELGDLDTTALRALEVFGEFLDELETTAMTRCFKMVTLEALLELGGLAVHVDEAKLAERSHSILRRTPVFFADVVEGERVDDLDDLSRRRWLTYWRKNPIQAWSDSGWFRVEDGRFRFARPVSAELDDALNALVRELVDYRLAQYRRRTMEVATGAGFVCRVTWNQRDPILSLPANRAAAPTGETEVRTPDGAVWTFRFAAKFCNVARPVGVPRNALGDLLRSWFGANAGQPGTHAEVRFARSPDGWWVEPVRSNVVEFKPRSGVRAFPDLRAAAGYGLADVVDPVEEEVLLPGAFDESEFAVRVVGSSMDGGKEPLRDGDWAVMRLSRSMAPSALENRVVLVQVSEDGASQYVIKRLASKDSRWELKSDNPSGPTISATGSMTVIARLARVVRPEDLGPVEGSIVGNDELGAAFGLGEVPARSGRYAGHLFVFIADAGHLETPTTVKVAMEGVREGETAFVFTRAGVDGWRYAGVGRRESTTTWRIPEVDFETWRALGQVRSVSRDLPGEFREAARRLVEQVFQAGQTAVTRPDGQAARIVGRAPRGGVRIDGGPGGFAERTISLEDLGWVLAARQDVEVNGGVLDEARVNKLRYLSGTPKGSTRWIDTGWAIGLATGQA